MCLFVGMVKKSEQKQVALILCDEFTVNIFTLVELLLQIIICCLVFTVMAVLV